MIDVAQIETSNLTAGNTLHHQERTLSQRGGAKRWPRQNRISRARADIEHSHRDLRFLRCPPALRFCAAQFFVLHAEQEHSDLSLTDGVRHRPFTGGPGCLTVWPADNRTNRERSATCSCGQVLRFRKSSMEGSPKRSIHNLHAKRGLARFQVLGRDADRDLIRSVARRLAERGRSQTVAHDREPNCLRATANERRNSGGVAPLTPCRSRSRS
jgi:hypothetical protein